MNECTCVQQVELITIMVLMTWAQKVADQTLIISMACLRMPYLHMPNVHKHGNVKPPRNPRLT